MVDNLKYISTLFLCMMVISCSQEQRESLKNEKKEALKVDDYLVILTIISQSEIPNKKTIQVDSRIFSYAMSGTGPVLVLEAGLGDNMDTWKTIYSDLAKEFTILVYDRAGYGGSSASPETRNAANIAKDLSSLLDALQITAPFYLGGHSLGGLFAEYYAKVNPTKVRGLIFVDTRHRNFTDTCVAEIGESVCKPPGFLVSFFSETAKKEYTASVESEKQVQSAGAMPNIPIQVLSAETESSGTAFTQIWQRLLRQLAAESSQGNFSIVTGTGHYIHKGNPGAVISAAKAIKN